MIYSKSSWLLATTLVLGMSVHTSASAYSTTATVTLTFGGNSSSAEAVFDPECCDPFTSFQPYSADADLAWTSFGQNSISSVANSTYFSTLGGWNGLSYYNPDFATTADCAPGDTAQKYGCKGSFNFPLPVDLSDPQPRGQASGTITVTDTTLTGVLTILSTTDEPTGGTTTTVGNGFNGYNYRYGDASPFGNAWNGISTAGTYQLNLTGTFTASSWQINGGSARFLDPASPCQQLFQSFPGDALCGFNPAVAAAAGQVNSLGTHLSFGWDIDGKATGTIVTAMEVRDSGTNALISTLSGVLASLAVDGTGNITTNAGEFRRGQGAGACLDKLKYNGSTFTCGTLTVGKFDLQGTVVPIPPAALLFAGALGALGWVRRKTA